MKRSGHSRHNRVPSVLDIDFPYYDIERKFCVQHYPSARLEDDSLAEE